MSTYKFASLASFKCQKSKEYVTENRAAGEAGLNTDERITANYEKGLRFEATLYTCTKLFSIFAPRLTSNNELQNMEK